MLHHRKEISREHGYDRKSKNPSIKQDTKPQPLDLEACVLALCHNSCPFGDYDNMLLIRKGPVQRKHSLSLGRQLQGTASDTDIDLGIYWWLMDTTEHGWNLQICTKV